MSQERGSLQAKRRVHRSSRRKCLTQMNIITTGSDFVLYCFLIISRILVLLPPLVCELFGSEAMFYRNQYFAEPGNIY